MVKVLQEEEEIEGEMLWGKSDGGKASQYFAIEE